ncbi:MAG: hypothetical protein HOC66_02480, partial [Flavobacteriales bacterium]|nr:hypothetical protein [Flavobacteriales bacterium]
IKSEFVDVEIRGVPKFNSGWLPIKVNYGVGETIKIFKKTNVLYDNKKVRLLNSTDFINFFTTYGYEHIDEMDKGRVVGSVNNGIGSVVETKETTLRFRNNNN